MPKRYEQFKRECAAAGLEVTDYRGRNFYDGPAVRCDNIQEVLRHVTVECQYDNMGLGWIVYPR